MRNPAHAPPLTSGPHPCPSAVARHGPASRLPMEARAVHPASTSAAPPNGWKDMVASATSALRTRHQLALTL